MRNEEHDVTWWTTVGTTNTAAVTWVSTLDFYPPVSRSLLARLRRATRAFMREWSR